VRRKKVKTKLDLNKRTVAVLEDDIMSDIRGGEFTVAVTNCAACEDVSEVICFPIGDM